MFEDLISNSNEKEEKPNLNPCTHVKNQHDCNFYIPGKNPKYCEYFGQLSSYCYRKAKEDRGE